MGNKTEMIIRSHAQLMMYYVVSSLSQGTVKEDLYAYVWEGYMQGICGSICQARPTAGTVDVESRQ